MGGNSGGKTSQNTTQSIDPTLQPLFGNTAGMILNQQANMPGFEQFFQANPQQIPGLTQGQQNVLGTYGARAFGQPLTSWEQTAGGMLPGIGQTTNPETMALQNLERKDVGGGFFNTPEQSAFGGLNRGDISGGLFNTPEQSAFWNLNRGDVGGGEFNTPENMALGQINQFAGGEIGQSPATRAAMAAVRNPVLNDLALAGLGNSDAVGSGLETAYAPILAQELAIRAGVIPQLANMGAQQRAGVLGASSQLGQLGSQLGQRILGASSQLGQLGSQLGQRVLGASSQAGQLGQQLRGGQATSAQMLAGLGGTEAGRQSSLLGEYGTAEEAARQVEAQRGQAELADFLRRQGLGQNFTTGVLSGFPALTNTNVVGKTTGGGK